MKNVDYYDSVPYKMAVAPDVEDGGYVASFPDLPGCHHLCGYQRKGNSERGGCKTGLD